MLKPTLHAVRAHRLAIIRRLYGSIVDATHHGVGLHALVEATTAAAAALNAVGVDKTRVVRLIQFQKLVQRLGALAHLAPGESPEANSSALIALALEIAAKSAELTDTQYDDELVRQAAAYLADDGQQALLADLLDYLRDRCPAGALAPTVGDYELFGSWAAERKLDAAPMLNLLPYVIETAHMAEDLRRHYAPPRIAAPLPAADAHLTPGESPGANSASDAPRANADMAVAHSAEAALGVGDEQPEG